MLVVRTELWPYGYEDLAKTIGETRIWNIRGSRDIADYGYSHSYPGVPHLGIPEIMEEGNIFKHNRGLPLPELYKKVFNEFEASKFQHN